MLSLIYFGASEVCLASSVLPFCSRISSLVSFFAVTEISVNQTAAVFCLSSVCVLSSFMEGKMGNLTNNMGMGAEGIPVQVTFIRLTKDNYLR